MGPRASLAMVTKIEKCMYMLGIEETWSSALYQHCVVEQSQHYFNECTVIKYNFSQSSILSMCIFGSKYIHMRTYIFTFHGYVCVSYRH